MFPCVIYEHFRSRSEYLYFFFESEDRDSIVYIGWARCYVSQRHAESLDPIKTGVHKDGRIMFFPDMPDGLEDFFAVAKAETRHPEPCKAEINDNEMRIYRGGRLYVTLKNDVCNHV